MLSDEEKKEYEELKSLLYTGTISQYGKRKLIDIIEKQSKEIEELKDMNERQQYRIELVSEDEIEERGDSIDESTMLKQIKNKLDEKNIPIETLLAEFERLEDLEDRKVQIEYNNVFNKGVKSVEDKIKAKIEEVEIEQESNREDLKIAIDNLLFQNIDKIGNRISINMSVKEVLQSLLEKKLPTTITKEELEKRWKGVDIWTMKILK